MKTKYIFASCLLAVTTFTGCQDLDTFPEGGTVTTDQKEEVAELNPERAEAGINAIFAQFNQYMPNYTSLGTSRHNDFGYPSIMLFTDANGYDVISDDNGYNWTGNDLTYDDRSYTSYECQITWNDLYNIIFSANNAVSSLDPETTDPTIQKYLGQALAARAFSYFVLAQLYQFNYVGHESSPCVPLITNETLAEASENGAARASVKEVYDQVEADLNQAIQLLEMAESAGEKRKDGRYINAAVAYGIRARVNLTKQNWQGAADDAEKAITLSGAVPASITAVSKPTFWSLSESNWMWGILVEETDDVVSSGIVNWISHMGSLNYGYANYSSGKQINKILYQSIPDTDVRKGWWLNEEGTSPNLDDEQSEWMAAYGYPIYTQVKFGCYNEVVGQSTNANDIPLMRVEEMYLIKAEAQAMAGNAAVGKSTLESFVQTYRDPAYTCSATSAADIQEEVYRQRRIELWGEGLNWFDIMRLNKDVDRRGAGYPNATSVYNIPAGSDILLWRIPENEIQANKALSEGDNNPAAPVPTPVADID